MSSEWNDRVPDPDPDADPDADPDRDADPEKGRHWIWLLIAGACVGFYYWLF